MILARFRPQAIPACPPRSLEPASVLMVRLVLRLLGNLLLAAAFVLLVVDVTRSLESARLILTPLEHMAAKVLPAKSASIQTMIEGHAHPLLWDPVLVTLFRSPAFLILGTIALILLRLARARPAKIGFSSR